VTDPNDLFGSIQKMQADMQAAQDALANTIVEATVGGGVVKATMTAAGELKAIKIDASVVDPDDIETLEDLVVAAVVEVSRIANERQAEQMGAVTGGIDINSMLGGLGGGLGLNP
jgi:DNA-binding YbaB/EbfC family protein